MSESLPRRQIPGLVSVIIPVYNVASWLTEALQSVIAQTYPEWEAIVVDDGSTDGSGDICDSFAWQDDRFTVLHTDNHGLSAARNLALEQIRGEYFCYLDSDDSLFPDFLQITLDTIRRTGADVVCGGHQFIEGNTPSKRQKHCSGEDQLVRDDLQRFFLYKRAGQQTVWGKLYRSDICRNVRFIDGLLFEDNPYWAQILQQVSSVYCLRRPVLWHRINDASIMGQHFHRITPRSLDILVAYTRCAELVAGTPDEVEYRKMVLRHWLRLWRKTRELPAPERRGIHDRLKQTFRENRRWITRFDPRRACRYYLQYGLDLPLTLRCRLRLRRLHKKT